MERHSVGTENLVGFVERQSFPTYQNKRVLCQGNSSVSLDFQKLLSFGWHLCTYRVSRWNVVARWPGSAHDSTVFNNSAACLSLKTNALYQDFHLLGDTGYACEKYLLTPFGNPRSLSEARYNKSHVLTRNTIERKYGILKRRFPCLSVGLNCHIDRVPAIVVFFTTYVYAWRILNHLQIPR
ncbi:nuclease HARBI1 [Trichonephila clavipes]|nr:nuclease HARBI1 [Trichonephila clavipes]